jgi:cell division protein ZapA
MADVTVEIGGNSYTIACREGEEAHLTNIASLVDRKATEAREAVGGVSEVRQLLFASLLLADELSDLRKTGQGTSQSTSPDAAPSHTATDQAITSAIEQIALRVEALATKLENRT